MRRVCPGLSDQPEQRRCIFCNLVRFPDQASDSVAPTAKTLDSMPDQWCENDQGRAIYRKLLDDTVAIQEEPIDQDSWMDRRLKASPMYVIVDDSCRAIQSDNVEELRQAMERATQVGEAFLQALNSTPLEFLLPSHVRAEPAVEGTTQGGFWTWAKVQLKRLQDDENGLQHAAMMALDFVRRRKVKSLPAAMQRLPRRVAEPPASRKIASTRWQRAFQLVNTAKGGERLEESEEGPTAGGTQTLSNLMAQLSSRSEKNGSAIKEQLSESLLPLEQKLPGVTSHAVEQAQLSEFKSDLHRRLYRASAHNPARVTVARALEALSAEEEKVYARYMHWLEPLLEDVTAAMPGPSPDPLEEMLQRVLGLPGVEIIGPAGLELAEKQGFSLGCERPPNPWASLSNLPPPPFERFFMSAVSRLTVLQSDQSIRRKSW